MSELLLDSICGCPKNHPTKENCIETKKAPPQLAIAIITMPPPIINHSQRVTQRQYPYPLAAYILFLNYASKYTLPSKYKFPFFLDDIVLCWSPPVAAKEKVAGRIICSSNPSRHSHSAGSHFMVAIFLPLRIQFQTYPLDPSPMYPVPRAG